MRKLDLIRFINSELTEKEREEVSKWLNSSRANREYFNNLKTLWVLSSLPDERADVSEYDVFESKFFPKKKKTRLRKYLLTVSTVAASLLVFLFIGNMFIRNNDNMSDDSVLIANNDTTILHYTLPDNTKVVLYEGSEVLYSQTEFLNNRTLSMKGKVFLDVVSTVDKQPFKVSTEDNINILVTGTRFFVNSILSAKADREENSFEIYLEEGSVSVSRDDADGEIQMSPGDMVIGRGSMSLVKISNTNVPKDISRLKSYFRFENTKMDDVLDRLSKYHNVSFICKREEIKNMVFTGDLYNESIDSILSLFGHCLEISYSVKNKIISLY